MRMERITLRRRTIDGGEGTGVRTRAARRRPGRRFGDPRRVAGRVSLVAVLAIFVGVLFALAPTAAGQKLGPLGKHGPPFTGSVVLGQGLTRAGCAATAKFLAPPSFSLKTGIGKVSSKSSASGCGPSGLYDLGATNATLGFDSKPFNWSSPGPVPSMITFKFTVDFVVNLSATLASAAGGPSAWAIGGVFVHINIYDLTTGTWSFGPGSWPFLESTNGSATGYVNQSYKNLTTITTYSSPGIVSGDEYTVVFYATTLEIAYAPSHTATSATALLNMATGGEHFLAGYWDLA
jgi:hypothetical protein